MRHESTYYVYWEGPFDWGHPAKAEHVLYQIYGAHPLYGQDVLLYIGLTARDVNERLSEHEWWVGDSSDRVSVRYGSVGKFTSWPDWKNIKRPNDASNEAIRKIEALLIYANQPAFNTANKKNIEKAEGIRVFNTGTFGRLLPEISFIYYWGQ
jgi:hypothetical protein